MYRNNSLYQNEIPDILLKFIQSWRENNRSAIKNRKNREKEKKKSIDKQSFCFAKLAVC